MHAFGKDISDKIEEMARSNHFFLGGGLANHVVAFWSRYRLFVSRQT